MFNKALRRIRARLDQRRRRVPGHCLACGWASFFLPAPQGGSQREAMHCVHCGSSSRKRHVVKVLLDLFAPGASSLRQAPLGAVRIYSAVAGDVLQRFLAKDPDRFFCSELMDDLPRGALRAGVYCQDLEALTFGDSQFDLVVTEDVLEHVRCPDRALREIARVLKPGGYHVFTLPFHADRRTVRRVDAQGRHLLPAAYHYDAAGREVLVCTDWGYDLFDQLAGAGFDTRISLSSHQDALQFGIADSIVFFSRKCPQQQALPA